MARTNKAKGDPAAATAELDTFLKAHPETKHVDAFVHDLNGQLRGKRFPIGEAKKIWRSGVEMPRCLLFLDPTGDDLNPGGRSDSIGDPDGTARPVPFLLKAVPWASAPSAQILLQMHDPMGFGPMGFRPNGGKPSRFCPRAALAGVLKRMRRLGLNPVVAVELEFYLFDNDRDARGRPCPARNPLTGVKENSKQPYSIEDLDAYGEFIGAIAAHAKAQDIPASTAITEYSPGQFEINLNHEADAIAACDHAVLLKRCIKATARQRGQLASFMAKPFLDAAGSGMHVHVSLTDAQGANLFGETGKTGERLLRHAIGGLQATMGEAMALFGGNINAMRRYQRGQNVPMSTAWGHNNRSVAFRIPAGGAKARRIEHRVAGADANPYLVVAAILAGMLHGIEKRLDCGKEAKGGDPSRRTDATLPFEFAAAVERLAQAKILPRYIEPECLKLYVDAKRTELDKFMGAIVPREYEWYL